MPYGIDLRERVISAVDGGMHKAKAARIFKVARRVIYNWLKLRDETGKLEAKTGYQKGHSHKITDLEKFKQFADTYSTYSVPRMIIEWQKETNIKVSESCINRALVRLKYTSKKNFQLQRSKSKEA